MRATLREARDQERDTNALEREAEREAGAYLEERVNGARKEVTLSYVAAFGSADAEPEGGPRLTFLLDQAEASLRAAMDGAGRAASEVIRAWTVKAALLGAEHAQRITEEFALIELPSLDYGAAEGATKLVESAEKEAVGMLSQALVLAGGLTGLLAPVARATKATNDLKASARWSVNRGHATGVRETALAGGYGRVWVAERDGCVHCLAYAGQKVLDGGSFPLGLTFADKPLEWATDLPDPPLHPNCRCQTIPWKPSEGEAFPDALKREARRSVAKGWRVESESEAVRLRAAENLLRRGPDLPKSVVEATRRSLKKGKFPTRRVPSGSNPPTLE